ncbi:hypothetical protein P4V37_05380 [Bacillus subtilis]|uniref:hypothetical protein n=1 Tax=Bacillus subtilis TaxID=1423 RepID=UPI000C790E3E|nr:hypothetical protein [Bacillus subtilis]MEC2296716.1 hypothetical protein [Bacillus subtilis]MED1967218.1 hypothetical protein [Bacillus subtilis]MED1980065.1 hypothetical protein [Bacillus subtilis]MED1992008.1 hypothetical protein [Bacillus subtilis]MED4541456.1 hypothetical protein [Bacillus subtilis]
MLLDEKLDKLMKTILQLKAYKEEENLRRVIGEFHSIIDYAYEGMYIAEDMLREEESKGKEVSTY